MIDIARERPIPLADLGKALHCRIPYTTVWHWWRVGVLNRETGERVTLETIQMPRGRSTTVEAYMRFVRNLG